MTSSMDDSINHAWIFDKIIPIMRSPLWMTLLTPNRRFIHQIWKGDIYLEPVLTRMITCFQFDFIYFVQFNLHLIGRKVNLQAVISKRVKFDKKSSFTFSFDFFVQFGEFVQLDVACPMKPKQTTQTYALSSTASEARSINLERQGHRSGRSTRPDGP